MPTREAKLYRTGSCATREAKPYCTGSQPHAYLCTAACWSIAQTVLLERLNCTVPAASLTRSSTLLVKAVQSSHVTWQQRRLHSSHLGIRRLQSRDTRRSRGCRLCEFLIVAAAAAGFKALLRLVAASLAAVALFPAEGALHRRSRLPTAAFAISAAGSHCLTT